jgi:hypothetical protein
MRVPGAAKRHRGASAMHLSPGAGTALRLACGDRDVAEKGALP